MNLREDLPVQEHQTEIDPLARNLAFPELDVDRIRLWRGDMKDAFLVALANQRLWRSGLHGGVSRSRRVQLGLPA